MADCVFDTSALLALYLGEPGAESVMARLAGSCVSTVIASEVAAKLNDKGVPIGEANAVVAELGVEIIDFTLEDAQAAAALRGPTRKAKVSFADRACLALAQRLGLPLYTADRPWTTLNLPLDIRLIR